MPKANLLDVVNDWEAHKKRRLAKSRERAPIFRYLCHSQWLVFGSDSIIRELKSIICLKYDARCFELWRFVVDCADALPWSPIKIKAPMSTLLWHCAWVLSSLRQKSRSSLVLRAGFIPPMSLNKDFEIQNPRPNPASFSLRSGPSWCVTLILIFPRAAVFIASRFEYEALPQKP